MTDFGIASVMDGSTELTTSQGILGTPTYMAPEMIDGGQTGPPADVYAAGRDLRQSRAGTGGCMVSTAGGYTPDGAKMPDALYATACDGSAGQQWVVASSTRFGQAFRNVGTGKCLDSDQESPNGTGYQAYTLPCSGNNYQNWT